MSAPTPSTPSSSPAVLYCHCAYAKVVPTDVRDAVLSGLAESGVAFEAVPDLCEMSARKDPALERFAGCGKLKVAACFPRAVHWLFHAAGTPLPEGEAEVLNMRTRPADEIVERALAQDMRETPIVDPQEELAELERAGQASGAEQTPISTPIPTQATDEAST